MPVDVLVTGGGTQPALAAKRATAAIRSSRSASPNRSTSCSSTGFARPGGNVTGLATAGAEITSKRLDLHREAVPGLSRDDFLWNPATPGVEAKGRAASHSAEAGYGGPIP